MEGCEEGRYSSRSGPGRWHGLLLHALIPTLRSFGPSCTILEGRISPGSGACTTCPSCWRVLCTSLRVPRLCFCVCQSACAGGHCVPARVCGVCAGPSCVNVLHLFARAFPVLQLTSSMHKAKEMGHRAHGQNNRMSGGKTTKRHDSGSVGKKTTSLDETHHLVVSLLPTEEDSSQMSGGKGAERTNSGSAVKKTTFNMLQAHQYI